jgi:hypothetical protein
MIDYFIAINKRRKNCINLCSQPLYILIILIGIGILSTNTSIFVEIEGKAMVTLNIDLQDGFEDDTVILEINNKKVFEEEHITTGLRDAVAKQNIRIPISSGEVQVKVNITPKNLVDNYKFTSDSGTYLGIRIVETESANKEIKFSVSKEPPHYF